MVRRLIGQYRLKNGGLLYLPPWSENDDVKTNWEDIDIFRVTTVKEYAIGTELKIGSRVFAYCEFGGTTAAGDLLSSEVPDAVHDALAPVAGAIGDNTITITSPASGSADFIANEYAGGHMRAEVNGSPGYLYDILSHPLLDISEAGTMVVTLLPGQGTAVAVAATDDFSFHKNAWQEVIQHATTEVAAACGVSMAIGADGSFGWVGVKGPHPVLTQGSVAAGAEVRLGTDTASVGALAFEQATDATRVIENVGSIGRVVDVGADTKFSTVNFYGFGLV